MALRIIDGTSGTRNNTTYSLPRKAVSLYPRTEYTDRKAVNALRRGWIKQIQYLGPKWLLHPDNAVLRRQAGYVNADVVVFLATVILYAASMFIGV